MRRTGIGAAAVAGLTVFTATGLVAQQQPDQAASASRHVDPDKIRAEGSAEITKDRAARIVELLMATATPQTASVSGAVHVGAPLPGGVDLMPLPTPVVDLVPEYRDYEYVVVNNEIVFVKPSTRQVVEVIDTGGG
jgi:hypothetical protein